MRFSRQCLRAALILAASLVGLYTVVQRCRSWDQLPPAIVSALPTLVELLTATIGSLLIVHFWPRREGRGQHCKRCGYYQEPWGKLAPACPECGAKWLWIGHTRRGRPSGAAGLVALGAALCLLALGASMVQSVAPWAYLRFLPQRVLLAQVIALPDDAAGEYWSEITRRKLPTKTLDTLADPLLRKKARDGYLSRAAEGIVFDAMTRPGAPSTSSAKYFASFVSATLDAPAQIEEGLVLAYKSLATFRGRALTLGSMPRVVVISALYAGDDPEPLTVWTWDVNPEAADAQKRDMDHQWTAEKPGVLRLRQEFWLAVGPSNAGTISWEAGQPVVPASMAIKDHFDQIREVTITPRPKAKSVPPG